MQKSALAASMVMLTTWAAHVGAQSSGVTHDSTNTPPHLCYRGHPAPRCDRFVITEIGFYRIVGSTTYNQSYQLSTGDGISQSQTFQTKDMSNQLTWEVGMMTNRGPRRALGATLLLGIGDGGGNIGLKGRYRRWLQSEGTSLDVGAGLIRGDVPSLYDKTGTGITADLGFNIEDYVALVARVDVLRSSGHTGTGFVGGVRLGSRAAIGGTIAFLALVVAAVHSLSDGY